MRHFFPPAALLLLALPFLACSGAKQPDAEPEPVVPEPRQAGPSGPQMPIVAPPAGSYKKAKKGYVPSCQGPNSVIKDDGQLETGYGYVPNATAGIYLQEYQAEEFANRELERVCVCWLHKRDDSEIDFEVVFYEKKEGRPAEEPYASRPGKAKDVPLKKESGGAFYDVDVSGVTLVPGTSYIGVRWNPSVDPFFFVCADHGPDSKVTAGFQRDDRAPNWLSVLGSPDPIFTKHKAMMLRAVSKPAGPPPPPEKVIYNKSIKRKPDPNQPPAQPAADKPEADVKTPPAKTPPAKTPPV